MPGQSDTVYIDNRQTAQCRIQSSQNPGWGNLLILQTVPTLTDPGSGTVIGNLVIEGTLTVYDGQMYGGVVQIHRLTAADPSGTTGILNIVNGTFTYNGGRLDADDDGGDGIDRTGRIFIFGHGILETRADPGYIGAKLFVGRDNGGTNSAGIARLSGNTTFSYDATIGVSATGALNLNSGAETVDGGIVNNLLENYGYVNVMENNTCEFYIQNYGSLHVYSYKTFQVAGVHTDPDGTVYSIRQSSGTCTLQFSSALWMTEDGYVQRGGMFVCDDGGLDDRQWNVNGPLQFLGGGCRINTTDDRYGTLTCSSAVTFQNANLLINLDLLNDGHDSKFAASSFTLCDGASITAREFNSLPQDQQRHEWQFLVGGVSGDWSAVGQWGGEPQSGPGRWRGQVLGRSQGPSPAVGVMTQPERRFGGRCRLSVAVARAPDGSY